jgi:hypothetical protein
MGSKETFQRFFQIEKWCPHELVMAKKLHVGQKSARKAKKVTMSGFMPKCFENCAQQYQKLPQEVC